MLENSRRTVEETKNGEEARAISSKDDSCLDSSCSQPVRDEKNKRSNDDISFQKMSKQTSSCEDGAWDPLNDGSSSVTTSSSQDTPFSSNPSPPPTTTGGIFSSVYDVASSLFNGGTPSLYYSSSPSYESSSTTESSSSTYSEQCSSQRRRPRRRLSNTSMHLVDTLYLF